MLVLSRKIGETLIIGDDIIVKLLNVDCGRVRLGISAPKHITVHRQEIYDRIQTGEAAKRIV